MASSSGNASPPDDPASDIEGLAEEVKKWDAKASEAHKERDKWREQWILSLAIANGGGLLAMLGFVGKPEGKGLSIVTPGFLFLAGVCVAGLLRILLSYSHGSTGTYYWAWARTLETSQESRDPASLLGSKRLHKAHQGKIMRWRVATATGEILSALLFIVGCAAAFLPLAVEVRRPPAKAGTVSQKPAAVAKSKPAGTPIRCSGPEASVSPPGDPRTPPVERPLRVSPRLPEARPLPLDEPAEDILKNAAKLCP